jgi:hypothetical protein
MFQVSGAGVVELGAGAQLHDMPLALRLHQHDGLALTERVPNRRRGRKVIPHDLRG